MVDIASNIDSLKQRIPDSVKLVAVSKTRPVGDIMIAYNAGQRCFGENRVQEILNKKDLLPSDIEWHLIGHLQSNKVKYVVPFINMIQSVDSLRLLETINIEASKINRVVDCLLQIYIAKEETKFGFAPDELMGLPDSFRFESYPYVRICGFMGMATFTTDNNQIAEEFEYLSDSLKIIKDRHFSSQPSFKELSMGMSGDFELAVKKGSTIVRIGSIIFGER